MSLPDLSHLSIASPIPNLIDVEHESAGKSSQRERTNPFQVPHRVPPRRRIGKQLYPRQITSYQDVLESLQRDQKLHLNLYNMNMDKSNDINIVGTNSGPANSGAAPLSPVTSPPYYWAPQSTSPLAIGDLMQPVQVAPDLQQQLQQFKIQTDNNISSNGIGILHHTLI